MIDRVHWIDKEKLVKFILDCQDVENGGISDRPDDAVDVYHTYFGVAGIYCHSAHSLAIVLFVCFHEFNMRNSVYDVRYCCRTLTSQLSRTESH